MFIQSCFIRENTPELVIKLKELEYDVSKINENSQAIVTYHSCKRAEGITIDYYDSVVSKDIINKTIDCGINDELFISLASLRDDTDKNQWFIYDNSDWADKDESTRKFILCTEDKIENFMCIDCMWNDCKRATTEELIDYFNNKWSMYRLKHVPTGLYYQPIKGKYEYATHLSKKGKIYSTRVNALNGSHHLVISISKAQYEKNKDLFDRLGAYNSNKNGRKEYKMYCDCNDFQKEFIKTI